MCLGSITRLVGNPIEGNGKWFASIVGANNCIYGIPASARRVVKFDPVDESLTEIGPDLGNARWKWKCGVLTGNGCIYCAPYNSNHFLKIDTNNCGVTLLADVEIPEEVSGASRMWSSGALATIDGCIYSMPLSARRILKLNPVDDTVSSATNKAKYIGTVAHTDNYLYGISHRIRRIIRFDPFTQSITILNKGEDWGPFNDGNSSALGRDGHIYAAKGATYVGAKNLKIDVASNTCTHSVVGKAKHDNIGTLGYNSAIPGDDGCIYWLPFHANRTLRYDPETQDSTKVGNDFANAGVVKWGSVAVANGGVIYFMPFDANRVL